MLRKCWKVCWEMRFLGGFWKEKTLKKELFGRTNIEKQYLVLGFTVPQYDKKCVNFAQRLKFS